MRSMCKSSTIARSTAIICSVVRNGTVSTRGNIVSLVCWRWRKLKAGGGDWHDHEGLAPGRAPPVGAAWGTALRPRRGMSPGWHQSRRCDRAWRRGRSPPAEDRPLDPRALSGLHVFQRGSDSRGGGVERRGCRPVTPATLVELVWAMKGVAFGREPIIERWLSSFPGAPVDRLPEATPYLQEDEPERVAAAVKRVVARI